MSRHKKKITIRVTAQTAYHLEQMAQAAGAAPGRIVDSLVTAARKGGSHGRNRQSEAKKGETE